MKSSKKSRKFHKKKRKFQKKVFLGKFPNFLFSEKNIFRKFCLQRVLPIQNIDLNRVNELQFLSADILPTNR